MATEQEKSIRRFSTRRLETLSDGVFAIAMTLLVLNLDAGEVHKVATNHQLWMALLAMKDQIISFLVSFLVLGGLWIVHTRQFEHIKESDNHLMWLNNFRLLAVVIIPFTTSLASDYSGIPLAQLLFSINFFIIILLSNLEWSYAVSKKSGLKNTLPEEERAKTISQHRIIIATAAAVVVLSAFINQLAFLLFFLTAIAQNNVFHRKS